MQVEKVDFIALQTQDAARSKRFYVETLGLPFDRDTPAGFEVSARLRSASASGIRRARRGSTFAAEPGASRDQRGDVAAGRAELEAKGVAFDGETLDTGVCHMAFFRDPDGNALMLHRRYAPYA